MITKKQIKDLRKQSSGIKKAVLKDCLDYENPQDFFIDLQNSRNPLQDGSISRFIYTADAETFAFKHRQEIVALWNEFEEEQGFQVELDFNPFASLAQFAYMQVFHKLAEELGLEI